MRTAYLIEPEDMARLREHIALIDRGIATSHTRRCSQMRHILSRTIEIKLPDKPEGGPAQCSTVVRVGAK
jgi:hypothetical protein